MEFLNQIIELLNTGKTDELIERIDSFLDENPQYKTIDYRHFANPIEEILYSVYIGDVDSIKQLDLDEPLEEIYVIYSIAHMMKGRTDEAERYLNTALEINPVSAPILMRLCEFYQQEHKEEKLKDLSLAIMKYTYDTDLLTSSYFKLADYLFHTNQNMELYDHLFNFFMFLKSGEAQKPVKEDIKYFRSNDVPVGINMEIIKILLYLIEVHTEQGMVNAVAYFKNILDDVSDFNEKLLRIENEGEVI